MDLFDPGFSSSSDDEEALMLLLCAEACTCQKNICVDDYDSENITYQRRRNISADNIQPKAPTKKPRRQICVVNFDAESTAKETGESSACQKLFQELDSLEDRYYFYFNMSKSSFEEIHKLVKPYIAKQDTNYKRAIGSKERLAICLRFMRSGDSFKGVSKYFEKGRSTVSNIVDAVSRALYDVLQPIYMPEPTEETWKQNELGFEELWNYPNCVGVIDAKYIRLVSKPKTPSIVILAIADPFCKFTLVDVADYKDHQNDVNRNHILVKSSFYTRYLDKKPLLPPKPLPTTYEMAPRVLIGHEGFALQPYLMKPFPGYSSALDQRKQVYNNRVNHVLKVVQHIYSLLIEGWGIFQRPMEFHSHEKVSLVIKAACCLHNFVRIKHGATLQVNSDEINTRSGKAAWKQTSFIPMRPINIRSSREAIAIRDKFATLFNT